MAVSVPRSLLVLFVTLALGGLVRGQSADQTNPPPQVPQRVRVSAGVSTGLLLKKVNPSYPEEARQKRIEGVVVLKAKISKQGDVVDLALVSCDPLLAKSAIEAVKGWKYRPYYLQGNPVEVETQIQVNFALTRH
jgi:periplasmic protein TonB